jgi:hypothetical protein
MPNLYAHGQQTRWDFTDAKTIVLSNAVFYHGKMHLTNGTGGQKMANEQRLIDANAMVALEDLHYEYDPVRDGCAWYRAADVWACIENEPTVDAEEVVHAYWTGSRFNPMTDEYEEYCSNCCAWSSEYGKPYCPNCGAKMDGGNEDG